PEVFPGTSRRAARRRGPRGGPSAGQHEVAQALVLAGLDGRRGEGAPDYLPDHHVIRIAGHQSVEAEATLPVRAYPRMSAPDPCPVTAPMSMRAERRALPLKKT